MVDLLGLQQAGEEWQERVEAAVGLYQPIRKGCANNSRLSWMAKELRRRPGPLPECTSNCSFMVLVGYNVIRFKLTKD